MSNTYGVFGATFVLTEDLGEIVGEDDCKCGLKGKYFLVHGRTKKAEIRGCGNIND